jgi:hypothetical protein
MRQGRIALIVSLALAAAVALTPAVAMAGRSHGGAVAGAVAHGRPSGFHQGGFHHGGVRPGVGFRPVSPGPHFVQPRHFGHRPFVRRPVPFGFIAAPIVYAPPLVYGSPFSYDAVSYAPPTYAPPAYDAPPVSYGPDAGGAISLAPPPQPTPAVVEFPTGRYELRGDGMATPYAWVWIPNPPVAPPSQAPSPGDPAPSSQRQLYRWTDEAGVAHWTDRRDAVPQPYRAEAQQPRLP